MMPTTLSIKRICLISRRVDFRKGHDGLLAEAYKSGLEPYAGDMVIFIGKNKNKIKILSMDSTGAWVLYKKFNKGLASKNFKFLSDTSISIIKPSEITALLEGSQYA